MGFEYWCDRSPPFENPGCNNPSWKPQKCERFPPPPPKRYVDAGVKCAAFPCPVTRRGFTIPSQPTFAIDHNAPIVVEWPPKPKPVEEYVETGPRHDLLALIPDQIAPQVVTMMAAPTFVESPGGIVKGEPIPHERCPDGAIHVSLEPKKKKPVEIRMPPREGREGIKGPPCRPWTQCVENTLITDQVRRPLARCCHQRLMPPLVISTCQYEDLKLKSTEQERRRAAEQACMRELECQRLASRQRQAKWNYTVESLLSRKRRKEQEKEEAERQATSQLLTEVAQEKKAQSEAQIARANQLILYRKGLIRDFHSALAYSKMMQEIEESKSKSSQMNEAGCPLLTQRCYRKMMRANDTRPDYEHLRNEKKKCSPNYLKALRCVEERAREQREEINNELWCMKLNIAYELPPLPKKYVEYMKEAECEDDQVQKKQQQLREEIFCEIADKLKADAFVESTEIEIDRQACEFNDYRRQVEAIRKAKEKQLIDDKVAYNIRKSDAAAKVLVQVQKKQKTKTAEYDRLREQWEAEFEEKARKKRNGESRRMDRILADFERRQRDEGWSRNKCSIIQSPARLWAREQLVAKENLERECEEQTERRRKAEDVALFNRAQISNKHCTEQRKKYMDDVWAAKMKQEYLDEMKEMKAYAAKCIEDWKGKGRSVIPMRQAMKKWDYDAGMFPKLFAEGDGDAPITLALRKHMEKAKNKSPCAEYETTSQRLGFGSGGS